MIDGIPIPVIALTPSALLGLTVLFILIGRLVPRSVYMDKVRECEKWQKAYELAEKGRSTSDAQTTELLEIGKASHTVLMALVEYTKPQRGEPHVVQAPRKK